ncbi:dephospho-CoA kinase [Melittangium boletus]|uniref:Dephospho-CoA kinase n=1 Tax=Melittangium boletus DSM 14713 TaxID=1294270 RepID=A0A286NUR7_9BACT|nr:dephospho-CoA kinase [Melittangium boletus]ATB26728.1 dephospho-CoA kinase [Melittangium boletus DSM 14713]
MKIYGLTGGIASGKSTASRMFREQGAEVLDADVLAREVVEPGTPGLAAVAKRFPGVVGPDGQLDRAKLGTRIFGDPAERAALNALLHPLIRERFLQRTQALAESGVKRLLYDVPLLIESGLHETMEGVVLVWVPRDIQRQRLMRRDGLSEEAAEARLAAQLPLDGKRAHAHWVVDNSGSPESTREQVHAVWTELLARS